MRVPRLPAVLALALLAGLSACDHLPSFRQHAKVRAIPATLPRDSGQDPSDRIYADATRAIEKREYDTALDLLQFGVSVRPDDARVLNALGVVYDKLGRFDLSANYYDQAEKADPGSKVVAANRRYSMMLQQGATAPAGREVLLAANDVAPTAPVSRAASAPASVMETAANPIALAAAIIAPAKPTPTISEDELYRRAVVAIEHKSYGEAIGDLRAARAIAPKDPRVLNALGVVCDWLGRFDLSARYYDLAEAAAPGSTVVAQNRRYSSLLQRHGGAIVGANGVMQAALATKGSPVNPTSHVKRTAARAIPRRSATVTRESHSG